MDESGVRVHLIANPCVAVLACDPQPFPAFHFQVKGGHTEAVRLIEALVVGHLGALQP